MLPELCGIAQAGRSNDEGGWPMIAEMTFRRIEDCTGIVATDDTGDSSLGEWYASVRDKPLGQFSDKDFGIACRQQLYIEFVVPT